MTPPVTPPVLQVEGLSRHYRLPRETMFGAPGTVYALNGVDFSVRSGQSFGIVGESGCGKSTLARTVMALEPATAGRVKILGTDLASLNLGELRTMRRRFQMVFQDPYGSLDPRHTVGRIVAEPLDALKVGLDRDTRQGRVLAALESVGLRDGDLRKYPHEFSGGQRQRIAIARAIVTRPALIVADEPVSALDVSVQAQVLNLLRDLQRDSGVAYVLISHDLAVVKYVCEEAAVMYLGRIVEQAPTEALFSKPIHPYTRALLDAVPQPLRHGRRKRNTLKGAPASQTRLAPGCAFADRCPIAEAKCLAETPALREISPGHTAACHFAQ